MDGAAGPQGSTRRSPALVQTSTPGVAFWFRAFVAIARRPRLWWVALVQLHRIAPRRWWRRPPFVPVPDRRYLEFRWSTAYGPGRAPRPADVVVYLEWCRERRR